MNEKRCSALEERLFRLSVR